MIDIKQLRQHPDDYQHSANLRGIKLDIKQLLDLDGRRLELIRQIDELRSKLNLAGKPAPDELKQLQQTKQKLARLESKFRAVEEQLNDQLWQVPNLVGPDTPQGGEEANRVERKWGEASTQKVKDHLELAEANGWVDFERGTKVAGHKFYFLKGSAVKLEMALKRLAMEVAEETGFLPMDVPHLINGRILAATGFTPKGEEEQHVYKIEGEDLHLIGTAELPLTGYHADEILAAEDLPKLYVGWSPSYRREAGSYGQHSKGLFRVHQFNKLELYVFCLPEESDAWLQKLVKIEEEICQKLDLPYRVTRTAAGDMGTPHYQKYDLEYWSPAENRYRELTSAANCTDYQARRLGIRVRTGEVNRPVHTLNATAVAISRTLVAILENHQQSDGSVRLPAALVPYFGRDKL
jgi:seryl-tRNA synthetase